MYNWTCTCYRLQGVIWFANRLYYVSKVLQSIQKVVERWRKVMDHDNHDNHICYKLQVVIMYSLQICMRKWPRGPCSTREASHRAGALTWYPPTYTNWIVDEYSKTVWVCQFWLKCFKFCSLKNSFRGLKKVGIKVHMCMCISANW